MITRCLSCIALLALPCCSTDDDEIATARDRDAAADAGHRPRPIEGGHVTDVIEGASTPSPVDLVAHDYVAEELFLEGNATGYVADGELGLDGKWLVASNDTAAYKTRLLVRRPASAEHFNGTVVVEWLNVTMGSDAAIGFTLTWEELVRGGYGYVGVSVQKVGVDSLKGSNTGAYGALEHPGDAYAYDIFSQAGAAVGWPTDVDPLRGLPVRRLLAYGESQSAMRMITYVNAIHPLSRVFNGFIVHSRAGWGAPIGTESDGFLGNGKPVHVRDDTDVPVLQFFTESEIFLALGPAYAARQPDTDRLRTWEVAGAAHADQHMVGGLDVGCGDVNDGPQHLVLKAGVRHMQRWLTEGTPPPHGAPLEVNTDGTAIARDADGNALGGIRTPAVDVPTRTLSGEPAASNAANPICMLFGQTVPFTPARLGELYPTHQDYVDKVTASARAARDAGFLLPEEEATVVAEAEAAPIPR